MDSAIHVGNTVEQTATSLESVSSAIASILIVGKETGAEQSTIKEALATHRQMAQVTGVTITNSTFTGDKVVNFGDDEDFGLRA